MSDAFKRVVGVSDGGVRVGQDHPRARLTDADLALLLALRAQGMSYGQLAEKFEAPKNSVAAWCKGRRRVMIAVEFRVVCG